MALLMVAGDEPQLHAIRLLITGFDRAEDYRVYRQDLATGAQIKLWSGVLPSNGEVLDYLSPFNEDLMYVVEGPHVGGHPTFATASGRLTFPGATFPPAIDTSVGEWPFLRAPMEPDLGMFKVPVMGYTADFRMRAITHSILGSPYPVVSSDLTELKSGTMQWATSDARTRLKMIELVSSSNHLLHLRAPCVQGLGDLFLVVLDLQESVPVAGRPDYRLWTVQWQQVVMPDPSTWPTPPISGRWTWGDLEDWGSWGDLEDTGWNWYELELQESGTTPRGGLAAAAVGSGPYVGSL